MMSNISVNFMQMLYVAKSPTACTQTESSGLEQLEEAPIRTPYQGEVGRVARVDFKDRPVRAQLVVQMNGL